MTPLIVGNWKMHGDGGWLFAVDAIAAAAGWAAMDIALAVPATLVHRAAVRSVALRIAGQDCHVAASGAYTGGVSAAMLKEAGANMVLVGHSETRGPNEAIANADVRAKVAAASAARLDVILCVGETAIERENGCVADVVCRRLSALIPDDFEGDVIVAYEPIWAIGSGTSPTPNEICEIAGGLRERTEKLVRGTARIIFGGSVNADVVPAILTEGGVDGLLVGNASLDVRSFLRIVEAASRSAVNV